MSDERRAKRQRKAAREYDQRKKTAKNILTLKIVSGMAKSAIDYTCITSMTYNKLGGSH